ncbi:MAG: nuclease-related domain-containing protein [Ectobacillus sp.]
MIKKECEVPLKIKKLEALLRRLPGDHPQRKEIEGDLAKNRAGYKGEQSLDYYLSFLPHQDYFIFHDLRLPHQNHFFQLDVLLLSSKFFLIMEVKHISGAVLFDHAFHQLIRTANESETVFPDPILQAERQAAQLTEWLKQHKCPLIPVEFLVVMTNSSTLIKSSPPHSRSMQKVVRSTNLAPKIAALQSVHSEERLNKRELRRVCSLLLKYNTPHDLDILERFNISKSKIIKGVHCPSCYSLPMERKQRKWNCSYCSFSSKDAHVSSLQDYALIFGRTITNRQLRDFLQLSSDSTARKLLAAMNMPYTGTTKGREYHLPIE